jgi:small subunit ribosomal protein S24e
LLKRTEIIFEIEHPSAGTPRRSEVRKKLAEVVKADLELLFIEKMITKTGTMTTVGEANVYDSLDQARLVEPKHILTRNVQLEGAEK